jgi:chromosome segregation ATPase
MISSLGKTPSSSQQPGFNPVLDRTGKIDPVATLSATVQDLKHQLAEKEGVISNLVAEFEKERIALTAELERIKLEKAQTHETDTKKAKKKKKADKKVQKLKVGLRVKELLNQIAELNKVIEQLRAEKEEQTKKHVAELEFMMKRQEDSERQLLYNHRQNESALRFMTDSAQNYHQVQTSLKSMNQQLDNVNPQLYQIPYQQQSTR